MQLSAGVNLTCHHMRMLKALYKFKEDMACQTLFFFLMQHRCILYHSKGLAAKERSSIAAFKAASRFVSQSDLFDHHLFDVFCRLSMLYYSVPVLQRRTATVPGMDPVYCAVLQYRTVQYCCPPLQLQPPITYTVL